MKHAVNSRFYLLKSGCFRVVFAFAIWATVFSASATLAADCGSKFISIASAAELGENLEALKRGHFEVRHASSGRKYSMRSQMSFRPATAKEGGSDAIVGEMKFNGTTKGGNAGKVFAGNVDVTYFRSTETLDVTRTFIEEGFQRNGFSTLAVGSALKKFPETRMMTGRLIEDNGSLFKAALGYGTKEPTIDEIREAFMQTPLYKSMSANGFTEVDMTQSYYRPSASNKVDQLFLTTKRPAEAP